MDIICFFSEINSYMGQWQKPHIFQELESHGHTIHLFNAVAYSTFEQANDELIKYIKTTKINFQLFINSFGSERLFPETVLEIKRAGIKTLLICFDNLHAPFMHKAIAPNFDLVWLTSIENKDMFKHWGCNIIFMPYAANPNKFAPQYNLEIPRVGFIGSPYGVRAIKINQLLKHHIKCQIYSQAVFDGKVGRSNFVDLLKSTISLTQFKIGRQIIKGAIKKQFFSSEEVSLINSPDLERKPSVSFEQMNY